MTLLATFISSASENITFNKDMNDCIISHKERSLECLDSVTTHSDEKLQQVVNEKIKEINHYDFTQWWMGNKQQRDIMVNSFKESQKNWLKSSKEYCTAASIGAGNTDYYGELESSCIVNMNNSRIEEIHSLTPDLSK
jgi:uncharacterized protein YecT (DUF1311 family)